MLAWFSTVAGELDAAGVRPAPAKAAGVATAAR